MKALVVDDALFMRTMVKQILQKHGLEVIGEGCNGIEAIELYKKFLPDIVTLDITMPEMNGIDALKEIMKIDSNANIVMISAVGQESYIKECIINGAKHFIVKPFKSDKVISVIEKIISV